MLETHYAPVSWHWGQGEVDFVCPLRCSLEAPLSSLLQWREISRVWRSSLVQDLMWILGRWADKVVSEIWQRNVAWPGQWLSARREADSAMFEFVCRPVWRLYKNIFILVGDCYRHVGGVKSKLLITACRIHYSSARIEWLRATITKPPFRVKFSNMSESSKTSQADLCYVKRPRYCVFFPPKSTGGKTLDLMWILGRWADKVVTEIWQRNVVMNFPHAWSRWFLFSPRFRPHFI